MYPIRKTLTMVLLGLAVGAAGCESESFPDAPSARAPERSEANQRSQANQQAAPVGQKAAPAIDSEASGTQDLPPDHPPVGAGGGQAGGARGSNSGVQPPTAGPQGMSPEQFGKTGPLRWSTPKTWRAVKPSSNMRLAEYHLPAEQGGEPATLTAFYFGQGGGGSVQANIDRWVGQFQELDGKPSQSTRTVGQMKVHLVDATGTFKVGAAMGGGQAQPDWRMRGAIVESPVGNFFFKLTGPEATVDAHDDGFQKFVSSFRAANNQQ